MSDLVPSARSWGSFDQPSYTCTNAASTSRRLVTGELHSACSCASRGKLKSIAASGDLVGETPEGHWHQSSYLYVPANLLRGLACHVSRRLAPRCRPAM